VYAVAQGACPLDSGANLIPLFYLADVKSDAVFEYKNSLKDIVQDYEGGEFSLFFTNCEPLSAVSFDLQVGRRPLPLRCLTIAPHGVAPQYGDGRTAHLRYASCFLTARLLALWCIRTISSSFRPDGKVMTDWRVIECRCRCTM
jgi:hypothetical protein